MPSESGFYMHRTGTLFKRQNGKKEPSAIPAKQRVRSFRLKGFIPRPQILMTH